MSTAVATPPAKTDRTIEYVPLGGKTSVQLTLGMVRSYLCSPTRQGNYPNDADIVKFMMLCKARELDPWVGDAYLTGYDTQDGPQFSLITAAQALFKRAEISEFYDGIQSGVIVKSESGLEYREGDLVLDGETLVGGWAKCFRKDRTHPAYDALKLSTFNTGKSRWAKDPAGMIVKCAEASVLRKTFPTQLGGLYTREEMDHLSERRMDARESGAILPAVKGSNLNALTQRLAQDDSPSGILAPPADVDHAPQNPPDAADEGDYDKDGGDQSAIAEWESAIAEAYTAVDLDDMAGKLTNDKRIGEEDALNLIAKIGKRKKALKTSGKPDGELFAKNKQMGQ